MNQMKIAITTDTNSGMMPHEADEKGIFVLPMPFIIDEEVLLESVSLSRDDFYQKLKNKANITTSQPSIGEVTEFWRQILKEYDQAVEFLLLHIS
jgi:fatty acid-binding protein DegV